MNGRGSAVKVKILTFTSQKHGHALTKQIRELHAYTTRSVMFMIYPFILFFNSPNLNEDINKDSDSVSFDRLLSPESVYLLLGSDLYISDLPCRGKDVLAQRFR